MAGLLSAREEGKTMEALAEQPVIKKHEFDIAERHRNDGITLFAESLDGSMRTPTRYEFNGHELYAEDGGSVRSFFDKGLADAENLVLQKPNLRFELRRRIHEYNEYKDMIRLCKGELTTANGEIANALVVTSDFPEELADITEDVGGYKASRKETMMRVITFKDGKVQMFTQTLDGSNRQALEAIHRHLDSDPQEGELLGQRIKVAIPEEDQALLTDRLMGVYDRSMAEQFGGLWRAGRRLYSTAPERDTYQFACRQVDLVGVYVKHKMQATYDTKLQYQLLAMLHERYEANSTPPHAVQQLGAIAISPHEALLMQQIYEAGTRAQAAGKTFSACGGSVGPDGILNSEQQLTTDGYGNRTDEKTSYKFDKKTYCVVCQSPPKQGEGKKMCGPCNICKTCDTKISKKV